MRCIGALILGIVYARNLELVHECLHGTALHNKRLGNFVGRLLALPMLVSFAQWRIEHAQHHHDVRREGFRYEYERLHSLSELIAHIFMIRHFNRALRQVFSAHRSDVHREHLLMLLCAIVLGAISLADHFPLIAWLWFFPLIPAAIVHTHIELPEHFGRECDVNDAFRNSRIILANRFVTWFVNANNYHALHHWNTRIPIDRLSLIYATMLENGTSHETYGRFFFAFYRGLFRSSFARVFGGRWTYLRLRRD